MSIDDNFIQASYFLSSLLFILSLGGLSNQESARKGNYFGIYGMALAVFATFFSDGFVGLIYLKFLLPFIIGGAIGTYLAMKVEMNSMPQLVAALHSFVGLAATIVGFASFAKEDHESSLQAVETSLGIFIGAVTFTGSIVAWGKLDEKINSKPLILWGCFRHVINAAVVSFSLLFIILFSMDHNGLYLMAITFLALFLGWHLVMAIGGADMPVVVSMLNSYSGWATSASGFMLKNKLLVVSGALIGSSGAILSYIMCKAMNRSFISVIMGGFGIESSSTQETAIEGEMKEASSDQVAKALKSANSVIIVPGYGMAVSKAQHSVGQLASLLKKKGKNCRFCIHPVAGRLPGHMNVILAEAKVPYNFVLEMEHINKDFPSTDVVIVIGANDIVNPDALENPASPIAGMPVCEVWNAKNVFVIKRGKGKGYAAIENPLFFKHNTQMFYGNADDKVKELLGLLSEGVSNAENAMEMKNEVRIEVNEEEEPLILPEYTYKSIGIPKETLNTEKRVAISPKIGRKLVEFPLL